MNILILSPHTDDAELGAGGTITKYLSEGHKIKWVVFSTAEESLPIDLPSDTLSNEFTNVYKSIGLNDDDVKIFHFKVRHLNYHRQEVLEELYKIEIAPPAKPTKITPPPEATAPPEEKPKAPPKKDTYRELIE